MFKQWKVPSVVDSIVVVDALTHVFLQSEYDLKAAQMNVQHSLI